MTLHVLGLPHTQTTSQYLTCAYTQKTVKFCKMMRAQGYRVILYSGEHNEAECDEHVPLKSEAWRTKHFGAPNPNGLWGNIDWDPSQKYWQKWNERAIEEIRRRAEPCDILCLPMGWSQKPIADALPHLLAVETGIGYEGIALTCKVFESYAWMHTVYGKRSINDGAAFDTVIPNFFEPEDFHAGTPEDYLLYIGRLTLRKGVLEAVEIARRAGRRLIVAGPGATSVEPGRIVCPEVTLEGDHIEHVGPVGKEERARLMAGAHAVLVPTRYVGPFEGTAAEALLSGTPVITTDFGAFVEYVTPHVGRRFSILREAVQAVEEVASLDRAAIRQYAISRFSLDAVGPMYDRYFQRCATLYGEGYYAA